jgi:transcriptional regulator with XRE-family HTH domain
MGKIDPEKKAELGRRLRVAREREGKKQSEIADLLGFSTPTLSRVESGIMPNVIALFLLVLFALMLKTGGLSSAAKKVKELKRYRLSGEKIKTRREKMGLSQRELAEELGISRTTVNRWEQGYFNEQIGSYRWLILTLDVIEKEVDQRRKKKEAKAA